MPSHVLECKGRELPLNYMKEIDRTEKKGAEEGKKAWREEREKRQAETEREGNL